MFGFFLSRDSGAKIQQSVVAEGATCSKVFLPLFFVTNSFKGGEGWL